MSVGEWLDEPFGALPSPVDGIGVDLRRQVVRHGAHEADLSLVGPADEDDRCTRLLAQSIELRADLLDAGGGHLADENLCAALGVNGRRYVLENFRPDAVAARYQEALQSWGFPLARQ